jgi:hypothetical protein
MAYLRGKITMATKSKRHNHHYYRAELMPGHIVWTCGAGDCTHHMPPHYESLLLHKNYYCFSCNKVARILQHHLNHDPLYFMEHDTNVLQSHPICYDCAHGIVADDDTDSIVDTYLKPGA